MQLDWPILSVLVWLPIAAGVLLLLVGDRNAAIGRVIALAASVLTFVVSVLLWQNFDAGTADMQFVERQSWIGAFNAWYFLGVDGISMPLIVLTAFITPLVVIAGWTGIEKRPNQYMAAFLILEGVMIGVFAALDALLFYVLWEAMLIPMFVIIGVWGGPRRVYATVKFFLYTFLGSVLMLVALIYMYLKGGSYSIADLQAMPLTLREQVLIFTAFLLAFAVKVPMWPVHTWLPDAHVEAPTGGSVILAAIMLKMGGYGFLRFSLPITPDASRELDWLVITLSLIAVVYIGFVALVQQDMKKLIAYSSIAHMGFVTLGSFAANLLRDIESRRRHIEATCLAMRPSESSLPEAKLDSRPFSGGTVVFYSDRVEICGVDICSGSRRGSRRIVLELLSRRRKDGSFIPLSGDDLESEAQKHGAKGTAAGWIRDLRDDVMELLRNRAGIICGHKDVILSGETGYRFSDRLTVQFAEAPAIKDITDIADTDDATDVPNGDVRDVFDVRDDAAGARQAWILEELAKGRRLKAPDVAEYFACSVKTAQRDLIALKDEGKIEFVGSSRTGCYRITGQ